MYHFFVYDILYVAWFVETKLDSGKMSVSQLESTYERDSPEITEYSDSEFAENGE